MSLDKDSLESVRDLVKKVITAYADFFKALTNHNLNYLLYLKEIHDIDEQAKDLNPEIKHYYYQRRSYLMKLFRKRLISKLNSQIEKEIISNVESLLKKIEEPPHPLETRR